MDTENQPLLNNDSPYNEQILTDTNIDDNYSVNNSPPAIDSISNNSNLSTNSEPKCRICLEPIENPVQYCECLNTLSFIHYMCLFKWLLSKPNNNVKIDTYNNHEEEYNNIAKTIDKPVQKCCHYRIYSTYYYCEICHYRYNIYSVASSKYYVPIIFNIMLLLSIIGTFILIIYLNYNSGIYIFLLIIIVMFTSITGSIIHTIKLKFQNNNLIILPHHRYLRLNA
jgi:hypothetical protein